MLLDLEWGQLYLFGESSWMEHGLTDEIEEQIIASWICNGDMLNSPLTIVSGELDENIFYIDRKNLREMVH